MGSIRENLSLLGLPDDASLEQANEAYKDLIRVWHPDRFASDPKLQKKAESQSKRYNQAIRELRRLFKDPEQMEPQRSPPRRAEKRAHRTAETPIPPSSQHASTHPLPNFDLYHSLRTILQRTLLNVVAVAMGVYMAMKVHGSAPSQEAFAIVIVSYGLSGVLLNALLLITRKPVFSMKNGLLSTVGIPPVPVCRVASAAAFQRAKGPALGITLEREYLQGIPQPMRALLKLRHFIHRHHIEVDFTHLAYHPAQVIPLLQQSILFSPPVEVPRERRQFATLTLANWLAVMVTIVAVARCFIGPPTQLTDDLPFLLLLLVSRCVVAYRSVM